MKRDTKDETNAKRRERDKVHLELAEHLQEVEHLIFPRNKAFPLVPEGNVSAFRTRPPPPSILNQDALLDSSSSHVVVGRLMSHQRYRPSQLSVDDLVAIRFDEVHDTAEAETRHYVGVAKVVRLPSANSQLLIHWFAARNPADGYDASFKPCWLTPNNVMYRASHPKSKNDTAMTQEEPFPAHTIFDHGFDLTRRNRVPVRVTKRACSIGNVPWKMKNHGYCCSCVPEDESD